MNLNIYKKIICINILTSMVKDHEYIVHGFISIFLSEMRNKKKYEKEVWWEIEEEGHEYQNRGYNMKNKNKNW